MADRLASRLPHPRRRCVATGGRGTVGRDRGAEVVRVSRRVLARSGPDGRLHYPPRGRVPALTGVTWRLVTTPPSPRESPYPLPREGSDL